MTDNQAELKYWLEKRLGRKTGFPFASITFHGQDETSASKAQVSIFNEEDQGSPVVRTWAKDEGDLRDDLKFLQELVQLLKEQNVERIAMTNEIVGCPHEEGVDFPNGFPCPECHYWAYKNPNPSEMPSLS